MDKELIEFAGKFVDSVEKMATATAKIGKAIDKMMTKFDKEMAKHYECKYIAKSGDKFKLLSDVTISEREINPDKSNGPAVIKAGTVLTAKLAVRLGGLIYQLGCEDGEIRMLLRCASYELKELCDAGILEKV